VGSSLGRVKIGIGRCFAKKASLKRKSNVQFSQNQNHEGKMTQFENSEMSSNKQQS
jgi:hypothetical protein